MPTVRRRDLIACLRQCLRQFLVTTGNLDVPIPERMSCWRMANQVEALLRDV
jgi:hypothetical protein